ncbi:MAG TPA: hypothetical protein VIK62_01795 [Verrucomicrobiae bacterium]
MNKIEYLAVIFVGCTIFSVFYWQVFHFVILKQARFQLFELRDEARRIAAERDLGSNESFKHLERFICKTITYSPSISFTSFILFAVFHRKEMLADTASAKEIKRFEMEAPREFLSIKESTAKFSLIIMALNSPWMIFFASIFAIALVALGKLSRMGLYRNAEKFVENIESESGGCLQPA